MKKWILIILGIIIVSMILFWCVEYIQKSNIYILNKAMKVNVQKDEIECTLGNSNHFNSWNYYYTIEDRVLYITAYNLSYFNPMAKHKWLDIKIYKGYDDIDSIYVNGKGENKVLIWSKDGIK